MIKKIRKLNNYNDSLYLTIPKYIVDLLKLEANQDIDIELKGKKIIINTEIAKE